MTSAAAVVRKQLDALLDNDTTPAFQLASAANRASTAPPDGYDVVAFDHMVRTSYAPLLAADDYRLVPQEGAAGAFVVVLYARRRSTKAYRFELSRQMRDDLHASLGAEKVVASERPWRTDAVVPLSDADMRRAVAQSQLLRQRALRGLCFGNSRALAPSVSHSFGSDNTHNLCCEIGERSKAYSDASGNPIGRAAEALDADGDLSSSPWSTCMGSNVCGMLGAMHGDTQARFAVSPDLSRLATAIPDGSPDCEAYAAHLLDVHPHATPGLQTRGDPNGCSAEGVRQIRDGLLTKHQDIERFLRDLRPAKPKAGVCVMERSGKRRVYGVVYFTELDDHSVRVTGTLHKLRPGKHGLHVHEAGDLTDECKSACAHLNPYGTRHGGRDSSERHVGDLGNIVADRQGVAEFDFVDRIIRLRRRTCNVIGRMLVVHEDEDDCGRGGNVESGRTGNAGKRIGCGVIGYASVQHSPA